MAGGISVRPAQHAVSYARSAIWRDTHVGARCTPCIAEGRHLDPLYGAALPVAEFGF